MNFKCTFCNSENVSELEFSMLAFKKWKRDHMLWQIPRIRRCQGIWKSSSLETVLRWFAIHTSPAVKGELHPTTRTDWCCMPCQQKMVRHVTWDCKHGLTFWAHVPLFLPFTENGFFRGSNGWSNKRLFYVGCDDNDRHLFLAEVKLSSNFSREQYSVQHGRIFSVSIRSDSPDFS